MGWRTSEREGDRTLGKEGKKGDRTLGKEGRERKIGRSEEKVEKGDRTLGGYDRRNCAAISSVATLRGPWIVPADGMEDLGEKGRPDARKRR
jgi:hypothetical protein